MNSKMIFIACSGDKQSTSKINLNGFMGFLELPIWEVRV